MSKIATIKRAIEKLERLKAESTPTRWGFSEGSIITMGMGYSVADELRESDADLIVTLHRTIEPQLSLLRLAVKYGELDAGSGSSFIAAAHDLALSILEETNE